MTGCVKVPINTDACYNIKHTNFTKEQLQQAADELVEARKVIGINNMIDVLLIDHKNRRAEIMECHNE